MQKEIALLYDAYRSGGDVELPPLKLHYKDYAQWQNRQLTRGDLKEKALEYWKEKLEGGIPSLELPTDSRGGKSERAGANFRLVVGEDVRERLNKMARDHHTTLFTVMFSAYNILLSHLIEQNDIVCGIIDAGRNHVSLQNIVGFFVNAIIFKCRVDQEESFGDFLNRMTEEILEAFTFQRYPVELAFEELKVKYPDISLAFNMLNIHDVTAGMRLGNLESYHLESFKDVKFDIELFVTEYSNGIEINCNYRKSLFRSSKIEYILEAYVKLLDNISTPME